MAEPIIMPRQGQSVESCILTEWKVNVGDQVAEGDVLAVIETDKASFDLESTAAGTVLALFWEADDDVPVLANVAVVGNDGEDVEEFRPDNGASASAPEPAAAEMPSSAPQATEAPVPASSESAVAPCFCEYDRNGWSECRSEPKSTQAGLSSRFGSGNTRRYRSKRPSD